jgi:hypothetical protein
MAEAELAGVSVTAVRLRDGLAPAGGTDMILVIIGNDNFRAAIVFKCKWPIIFVA